MENAFRESLRDPNSFTLSWELVPGRGAFEKEQEAIFLAAQAAARGGRLHALTITDNPGGNPAMSPAYLGIELKKMGIEPVVHLAVKDKSRIQVETELYALTRSGVNNILVITGDYPSFAFKGRAKPVFDLDTTHVLQLIEEMNEGRVETQKGPAPLKPTSFFGGAAVSPFKKTEAELLGQYYKLQKKLRAGAQFIVTQLGYDARKYHEIIQFMRRIGSDVPVMASLYVLSYPVAKAMNANLVPGCVVTDKLLRVLEEERKAPDKGKSARMLRAAKMYAMLKGMGYAGVHIGGHGLKYEEVEAVIQQGEELLPRWIEFVPEFDFPQENGFYLFKRNEATGLNTAELSVRDQVRSKKTFYSFSFRLMHETLFDRRGMLFRPMRWLAKKMDGSSMEEAFTRIEHLVKTATNNCQQCGDCALLDIAYICPMSQCPKNQRNGPCGGSIDGYCEVYPGKKKCFWVRSYELLKPYHQEDALAERIIPPVNWDLHHTSSWMNYYLGKDHSAPLVNGEEAAGHNGHKRATLPGEAFPVEGSLRQMPPTPDIPPETVRAAGKD